MCSLLTASQSSSCPAPDASTQGQQGGAEPNAPGDAAQTRVANLCSKQLSKSSLLVRNLSGYPQASPAAQRALLPLSPKSSSNSTDVALHFSSNCAIRSKNEKCWD